MTNELTQAGRLRCANCGTLLEGEFCHHCGQSVHSVLKPVHHMLEDGMDMFLHVDGRILHTLPPLFARPGFLTLEYFAGRRQRYVAPFRLMFVLCLLTFFAFHLAMGSMMDRISDDGGTLVLQEKAPFADDTTAEAVRRDLDAQLRGMHEGREAMPAIPGAKGALDKAEKNLRAAADRRLAELDAPTAAHGIGTPATPADVHNTVREESRPDIRPVRIRWLPAFANARINGFITHLKHNADSALNGSTADVRREARERITSGFFSVLPQSMLVMIPLFALLLKLFYVFRRRLYMEHLIVALHSHAFLFVALLLVGLTGMLSHWLTPHAAWLGYPLGVVKLCLWLWTFAYLLIMQKRIYRQGWGMTLLKYGCIGWCYLWLLVAVLLVALVLGAAH